MAGVTNPATLHQELSWVGTFSAGPVWEQGADTQTFYLTPSIEKTYAPNTSARGLFNGEIFLGLQKTLTSTIKSQLGLAAGRTSKANIRGEIWDEADPEFNNHVYSYTIQHTQVALKGKLLKDISHKLIPWVSGSLGVGINKANSFNNTPLICGAAPNPNYTAQTKTSLTYTLGAGIQKALNQHVQVGLGYEFEDWGRSELGRASEQTLNKGLGLSHFYTNGLLFNFTYVA